jgi:hypothetical protein
MERDVLCSHGVARFLREKFFNHSDGYTRYMCRCGKPAIVNHNENIYKCRYCKDNTDIIAVPSSWTSQLFMQEMSSCNVGIRALPKPFSYEQNDNAEQEFSKFEKYDSETYKKLNSMVEDMVDDGGTAVDTDE